MTEELLKRPSGIAAATPLVAIAALLSILVLVVAGAVTWQAVGVMAEAQRRVSHSRDVDLALERLLSSMRDAETGQRGYLLVGDVAYLDPYQAALPAIETQFARLQALTADNPAQHGRLPALKTSIDERLAWLARGIAVRPVSEQASVAILANGEGKRLMDEIRGAVSAMQAAEDVLLQQRLASAGRAREMVVAANGVTVLMAMGLIGLLFHVSRRDAERLRRGEERLAVIFSSIGDAVIATDGKGRVERMNTVAEQLTGWPMAEARLQPLEQVFRIVNEDTRAPVESPVSKVIREGGIVGLANHTVLLARDGSELPIEDSAAPIGSDPHGSGGIVLVFRDASELRALDRERARNEQRFRDIADSMPQIVYATDSAGRVDYLNRRWYEYTGSDPAAPQDFERHIHPEDRAAVAEAWRSAVSRNEALHVQLRMQDAHGHYRWFLTRAVPVADGASDGARWYGTSTDIDEQVQARQALAEADRRKDEFLATLAHELRNPLAPIRNAATLLRGDVPDAASRAWAVDIVNRQVVAMGALLDELLDISRITRGTLVLHREWVGLAPLLDLAIEQVRPLLDARRHQLTLALEQPAPALLVDPLRMTQIVANLLNNAAKYTEAGGHIVVSAGEHQDRVWIEVKDSGIGLDDHDLLRVFDMFTQVDQGAGRSEGGLGIGLALVRGLVELHGGSVTARSAGAGQGSTFRVEVPQGRSPTAPAGPPQDPAAASVRTPLRVLIADDNRDSATTMSMLLEMAGHEVRVAYDGEAALHAAAAFRPQVALIDLGMPKADGFEVARQLRASIPPVKLVALTGWGQEQDRERSRQAGFEEHLVKPADPDEVFRILLEVADRLQGRDA